VAKFLGSLVITCICVCERGHVFWDVGGRAFLIVVVCFSLGEMGGQVCLGV
jgi:hypothetical protein